MEYTKTVWKDLPDTSTPITADRLNNLENGVEYLFENESKRGINEYSESTDDSYSCNYANKLTTYSTDEIRVGTWMNKPLYRKAYYVNAFANNSNVYLDINVENVDTVISANGYAKNSSHTETIFLNSSYSNAIYDAIVWEESKNKLRLHSTSDRSGYSGYVWIEYTKTTDV